MSILHTQTFKMEQPRTILRPIVLVQLWEVRNVISNNHVMITHYVYTLASGSQISFHHEPLAMTKNKHLREYGSMIVFPKEH